jgi:group I intron endonuclease
MNEHYVYLYVDPRDGKVFYVGQGKGRRMLVHLRPSVLVEDSPKNVLVKAILAEGIHPMIVVVEHGLTQFESLRKEREWIAFYGKKNLTNRTTGGQGCTGCKSFLGRHHTEAAKELLRQSHLGLRNPMFGKRRTAEALAKFSEKMSGKGHPYWGKHRSEEVKGKISAKLQGYQWPDEERVKRSDGMRRVWEERKRTGKMPKRHRLILTVRGETKSLDEWAKVMGMNKQTFHARMRRGWSVEKALGI